MSVYIPQKVSQYIIYTSRQVREGCVPPRPPPPITSSTQSLKKQQQLQLVEESTSVIASYLAIEPRSVEDTKAEASSFTHSFTQSIILFFSLLILVFVCIFLQLHDVLDRLPFISFLVRCPYYLKFCTISTMSNPSPQSFHMISPPSSYMLSHIPIYHLSLASFTFFAIPPPLPAHNTHAHTFQSLLSIMPLTSSSSS